MINKNNPIQFLTTNKSNVLDSKNNEKDTMDPKDLTNKIKKLDQYSKKLDDVSKKIKQVSEKDLPFVCALRLDMISDKLQKDAPDIASKLDDLANAIENSKWLKD